MPSRDRREIARRVSEARRLLDEPLLTEALDLMERSAIEELFRLPDEADRARFDIVCRLKVIRGFRQRLENVITAGEQALKAPLKVA